MPRPATGAVVVNDLKDGGKTFALRFSYKGQRQYVTLGTAAEGWTQEKAEDQLTLTMAKVRAGEYEPPKPEPQSEGPKHVPTLQEFATEWLTAREPELAPRSVADYRWSLELHLLPNLGRLRLDEITVRVVDDYKTRKVKQGKIGAAQINKTLKHLAQIMDVAIEYELYERANPARGRRRRVKAPKPQRTWVEPEQLPSLLDCAPRPVRPLVAVLAGAGLRNGEACALNWRDINLATGTLTVGRAKTDAGSYREVDLSPALVEELTEWKMRSAGMLAKWQAQNRTREAPVFLSSHAGKVRQQSEANVSRRLKTAIRRANRRLAELGIAELSERVSPHSLRRTYASLRFALRDEESDPVYVAEQMGHADAGRLATNLYAKATKRRAKLSGVYLSEFNRALEWAQIGAGEGPSPVQAVAGNVKSNGSTRVNGLSQPEAR